MAKTTTAVANRGGKGRIPAPISSILWQNLSYIRNAIERDDLGRALLPADRKPDGALRQSLSYRVALLSDQLDKRSRRQLAVIITELMDKWTRRTSESEARQTTTAFVQALQDLPPWCVAEAAERFGRGLVAGHNIAWPPSAPQVHAEARKIVQPWRDERAAILEVLQAKIADTPPPAGGKGVGDRWARKASQGRSGQRCCCCGRGQAARRPAGCVCKVPSAAITGSSGPIMTGSSTVKLPDELIAAVLIEQEKTGAVQLAVSVLERQTKARERTRRWRERKKGVTVGDASQASPGIALGTARTYKKLVSILVRRRKALGMSQEELDTKASFTDRYVSKLEAYKGMSGRTMGTMSMQTWLGALGVKLMVVVKPEDD